ncbi:MAG: hypothetical protein L0956_07795 [Candidatus Mariimomonas ferrooxydans]
MSFPPACPVGRLVGSKRLFAETRFENLSLQFLTNRKDAGQAGMTTGEDDKGFLSFPPACRHLSAEGRGRLVGNLSLEIYNPPFTVWLLEMTKYRPIGSR